MVLLIPGHQFLFSPLVANECHPACVGKIVELSQTCAVTRLTDQQIDANQFLDLIAAHGLGDGETECLSICIARPGSLLCCDDRKAREVAKGLLGPGRVIGSLRLLKWSVTAGLISAGEAYNKYDAMKNTGGFLPDVSLEWFNT